MKITDFRATAAVADDAGAPQQRMNDKAASAAKEILLPHAPSPKERKLLVEFNRRFGERELQVAPVAGGINIMLWELDRRELRATVKSLSEGKEAGGILESIEQAIDAVKSYGLSGGRRHYVGYNQERKVKNRAGKEKARGKLAYAADFPIADNSPPPALVNKIVCGDACEVLRRLPDGCADLVFTSPPYNFGLAYANNDSDAADWDVYFRELFAVFDECIRVLRRGGRAVINVQPLFSDYIPAHHVISNFFTGRGMIWRGEILWEKNNYNCKYTAWGSWKSPSNPYLKYSWEFLEVFCKGDLKKPGVAADADISAEEFKKWVYGKWAIAPERGMSDKYGHPAMFPEALAMRVLKLFSFRGDYIIDPFNGAGTTTAVAQKNGRRYLGVDISTEYCKMAKQRLAI